MSPSQAFREMVESALWPLPGCFRSGGALAYVQAGKEIPELLLPGRLIMKQPERTRAALRGLTSRTASNVPDWVIKQIV